MCWLITAIKFSLLFFINKIKLYRCMAYVAQHINVTSVKLLCYFSFSFLITLEKRIMRLPWSIFLRNIRSTSALFLDLNLMVYKSMCLHHSSLHTPIWIFPICSNFIPFIIFHNYVRQAIDIFARAPFFFTSNTKCFIISSAGSSLNHFLSEMSIIFLLSFISANGNKSAYHFWPHNLKKIIPKNQFWFILHFQERRNPTSAILLFVVVVLGFF